MATEPEVDPIGLYLAELNWVDHRDVFEGVLAQSASFRRVDEPLVEDYAIAAVGLAMLLRAVPHHVVTKILPLLVKIPEDQLESVHIGIVNGAYLSLPDAVYLLPAVRKVDNPDVLPLVTDVYTLGSFWELAKKALCSQPA